MTHKNQNRFWKIVHILSLLCAILFLVSCGQSATYQPEPDTEAALRVYFFHLTARCDACDAIEDNTIKVLDEQFKNKIENGEIVFKSYNIDNKDNRAIAEKYQVSYTTLLLVRSDGTITDFTNTSLNYAYMNPEKFKELLKSEIEKNLE